MVTTPVYFLKILGNPTIEISQDELRSLLGELEAELHNSQVYRRALAVVEKLLGDSGDQAKKLLKAVGREAIGLTFRQFVQQYPKVETFTDVNQQKDTTHELLDVQKDSSSELSQFLETVKSQTLIQQAHISAENVRSQPQIVTHTANNSVTIIEENPTVKKPLGWLKNKKIPEAELAKQAAAQQRIESLRRIGEQLRQARQSQGISFEQLNVYTHVPMDHMAALENGNWELLPEDVFVRGFIRLIGNALGLNGTALAAALPIPEAVPTILPSWDDSKNSSKELGLEIRPMHLYVGYTVLVAGAVGGLALFSQQQANANKMIHQDAVTPSSSSVSEPFKQKEPTAKPGIKSSNNSVTVGSDISPPETL